MRTLIDLARKFIHMLGYAAIMMALIALFFHGPVFALGILFAAGFGLWLINV